MERDLNWLLLLQTLILVTAPSCRLKQDSPHLIPSPTTPLGLVSLPELLIASTWTDVEHTLPLRKVRHTHFSGLGLWILSRIREHLTAWVFWGRGSHLFLYVWGISNRMSSKVTPIFQSGGHSNPLTQGRIC